ncbi:kinase-like domain-containing protein [Xylaria telfairii]|nr:kinase-like domain-containing protein [Xylaria telfairii]
MDPTTIEDIEEENRAPFQEGERIGSGTSVVYEAKPKMSKRKKMKKLVRWIRRSQSNNNDPSSARGVMKMVGLPKESTDADITLAHKQMQDEVRILQAAKHHHVIKLFRAYRYKFREEQPLAIIMERADGDISSFLNSATAPTDDNKQMMRTWFGCLSNVVNHIHRIGIRHRDIKPTNILVKGSNVLLADFGISGMGLGRTLSTTVPGWARARTQTYCAPEVEDGRSRGRAADIFSLGAVFLELLVARSYPRAKRDDLKSISTTSYARNLDKVHDYMNALKDTEPTDLWSRTVISLCEKMMQRERDVRPTAAEVQSEILSSEIHCCDCQNRETTGTNRLVDACMKGNLEEAKLLISEDSPREMMIGALHQASTHGHLSIVEYLTGFCRDINILDYSGQTALLCASSGGHTNVVEYLLDHNAQDDSGDVEGRKALHYAAGAGSQETVALLLRRKLNDIAYVQSQDADGQQALHLAAKSGRQEVVRMIITGYTEQRHGCECTGCKGKNGAPFCCWVWLSRGG